MDDNGLGTIKQTLIESLDRRFFGEKNILESRNFVIPTLLDPRLFKNASFFKRWAKFMVIDGY